MPFLQEQKTKKETGTAFNTTVSSHTLFVTQPAISTLDHLRITPQGIIPKKLKREKEE
jgi:hypothetical protein